MRVRFLLPFTAAAFSAFALAAPSAHAEPSAWLSFGGGYGVQRDRVAGFDGRATAFTGSIGVGSSARNPFILGGVLRTTTYFTLGTDLGLAARLTTRGFSRGDWGFAIDAGVVGRWWKGQDYGHFPVQVVAMAGLPWGFQVDVGGVGFDVSGDRPTAIGGFMALELDFLRLTAMRGGSTTSWWPNPSPVDGARGPAATPLP